jgi:exopolyphosphatase/guanosine-5'-triphosphate,3'-diphosphate pyrophosphatase
VKKKPRQNLIMVNESPHKLASIDIGSNAIRLFVGQKSRSGRITILEDQRASVRLGKDAFSAGYIRPPTIRELERALNHFRFICERLNVHRIKAVGTSALRDSRNSRKVIETLKKETGIHVNLIDGQREAALVHKAVNRALDLKNKTALLLDMGGGSLEVILSRKGQIAAKTTLPLGTVRLLSKVQSKPKYEDIAHWVRTPLYRLRLELLGMQKKPVDISVGTGGNLRAIGKLCYRLGLSRSRSRFQRAHLEALVLKLFQMSLAERMKRFQLKKDRADVILPAAVVTLEMMRIFEINEITVPNVGLKNGLFWESMDRVRFTKAALKPGKIREPRG